MGVAGGVTATRGPRPALHGAINHTAHQYDALKKAFDRRRNTLTRVNLTDARDENSPRDAAQKAENIRVNASPCARRNTIGSMSNRTGKTVSKASNIGHASKAFTKCQRITYAWPTV
jgi:hypothetical protein